jgi:hypothetical protein
MDKEILRETLRDHFAERRRVRRTNFRLENQLGHASDLDLERYHLGMFAEGPELAALEEHLLICAKCVDRAEETEAYVDSIRAGIIKGNFDTGGTGSS